MDKIETIKQIKFHLMAGIDEIQLAVKCLVENEEFLKALIKAIDESDINKDKKTEIDKIEGLLKSVASSDNLKIVISDLVDKVGMQL